MDQKDRRFEKELKLEEALIEADIRNYEAIFRNFEVINKKSDN